MSKRAEAYSCSNALMKGSALVMEFPDRAAVDAYLASEPYVVEHVWDCIEVETMNVVILDGKM